MLLGVLNAALTMEYCHYLDMKNTVGILQGFSLLIMLDRGPQKLISCSMSDVMYVTKILPY